MRVLHCVFTLGGNGAECQLARITVQMAEDGLDTHVAFFKGGENLKVLQNGNVTLHALPPRKKYDPRMLRDIRELISRLRPDIVQTWLTQMDILAGMSAWWLGVPVVLSERSSELAYPLNTRHLIRCVVGRRAVAVVSNSEKGCDYWQRLRFQGDIALIRNGVPFELIRQARPSVRLPVGSGMTLPDDKKLILFAGRYEHEKNPAVLLEALSSALGRCDNAIAVLFGRGPMLGYMQSIHASLPFRQRIHILGYTDRLWEYMRRADIFISLSVFEGSPNVVLEATAAGCPLVLSDIQAHREIVDEESAMLVPAQDGNAAAEAMIKLLADPELASKLALAAFGRISGWSIRRAAQQYIKLYERVLF